MKTGRPRIGRSIVAAGLAGLVATAHAWGPTGHVVQQVPIVTTTDMLRAIAQVNPPAAEVLALLQPGRQADNVLAIVFGRIRDSGLATSATAELAIRGLRDLTARGDTLKPLPEKGEFVETTWHSAWTGNGGLDVTFDTRIATESGRTVGTAFPALTVHIASGDPAIVKEWRPATPQELADVPVQGPPAPIPNQLLLRVPTRLEPLSAIKAYSQALVRQDLDTVVSMTSPVLAAKMGGRDQLLAWWQKILVEGRTQHLWPTAEQVNDVRPLPVSGQDLYIVQSTRWFEDWPKPRGQSYVYLLSTPDKGRHWEVLDLWCTGLRWLHGIAPGFRNDALVADLLPDDTRANDPDSLAAPPSASAPSQSSGAPPS